jgi:hypothetical protein
MLIPIEPDSPEQFIGRLEVALQKEETHLYVDTSLLMWLTAVGPSSRAVFLDWAGTLGERIHVPAWSAHEFYRHHQRRTQVRDIAEKCSDVDKALKELMANTRVYSDGPLIPGEPEMSFGRTFSEAASRISYLTGILKEWDYEGAAAEVINWINERALEQTQIFEGLSALKPRGANRYSHDVPPGFEDRRKRRNRYGDLLFWEDVVSHASQDTVKTAVILTRDRKQDWFFSGLSSEPGEALLRLKGRWDPVPKPHPMLTFEMRSTAAADLILVDELYLSGLLWHIDKVRFGRLAAVGFGMDLAALQEAQAPPRTVMERAARRANADRIGMMDAIHMLAAAAEQQERPAVQAIRERLEGDAPVVEQLISSFTVGQIVAMERDDLAQLSRRLYELAIQQPSPASILAERLLDLLDKVPAGHASAIYGGMLMAAYYDGAAARNRPDGQLLQKLLEWRYDPALERVSRTLSRRLAGTSPAMYLPAADSHAIPVRMETSESNVRNPVAVGQVYFGSQALLVEDTSEPSRMLRTIVGGAEIVTVGHLASSLAQHYGVPVDQLEIVGAAKDEPRTILESLAVDRFGPGHMPIRQPEPAAAANEEEGALHREEAGHTGNAEADAAPVEVQLEQHAAEPLQDSIDGPLEDEDEDADDLQDDEDLT